MRLKQFPVEETRPEIEVIEERLSLDDRDILELGCGEAQLTRLLAQGHGRNIIATEVDEIAHAKNMTIDDLPNVRFLMAGAQQIPLADASIDVVFMFKSLHHVPFECLDATMKEIHRVLRPGGIAWISEPLFAGEFNEILRLFHDEEVVREAAFNAIVKSVESGLLELREEFFFNTPVIFENFVQFSDKVIGATHSRHALSEALMAEVEARFKKALEGNGGEFHVPIRVDLLEKHTG